MELLLLATANKTTDELFPCGNKKYRSQFCKMTQTYRTLTPLQTPWKFSKRGAWEELNHPITSPDCAAAFHCTGFARFLV